MDLVALKNELTNDPLSRGYSSMSDEDAAASLNAQDRTPDRESLDSGLLVASIDRAEYDALSNAAKNYLSIVVAAHSLPLTPTLKSNIGAIFGPGTATRANFLALMKRSGSRAEELGLSRITPSNVADARRRRLP